MSALALASCDDRHRGPQKLKAHATRSWPVSARQPSELLRACDRARNAELTIGVRCPSRVPVGEVVDELGHGLILVPGVRTFYAMEFHSGTRRHELHWTLAAGTRRSLWHFELSGATQEDPRGAPRLRKRIRRSGHVIKIYHSPQAPLGGHLGGHVSAVTRRGSEWLLASAHGYRNEETAIRIVLSML